MSGSRFYTTKTQSGNWVPLFDHLIGAREKFIWHGEAGRLHSALPRFRFHKSLLGKVT
jgi:hypothetical protein